MWGPVDDCCHVTVFDIALRIPRIRRCSNFKQLSDFERGRIVALREGLSFHQIAARLSRTVSAPTNCYYTWSEDGWERARRSDRPRQVTIGQERRAETSGCEGPFVEHAFACGPMVWRRRQKNNKENQIIWAHVVQTTLCVTTHSSDL